MRTVTHLFLILFVSFLAAPTIVSVINKSCDTSYFYSISEEELTHKAVKEFKMQITNDNSFKLVTLSLSIITSENQLKHDNITPSIFSPPPNA
jgi:hypothetical protein